MNNRIIHTGIRFRSKLESNKLLKIKFKFINIFNRISNSDNKLMIIDGIKYYFNNNCQIHNDFGPAVIEADGSKYWYKNGLRHNVNGPATIFSSGTKWWYKNDLRHNEYGPAIIWVDDTKWWYIDGVEYTKEEFLQYKIKNFIENKK